MSGQATFAAGELSVDIVVPVRGDVVIEEDENLSLGLTNPVNALLGRSVGIGSITNDDFPRLSVSDASVDEGDTGTAVLEFAVELDQPGIADISVDYASSDVTASAGSDYAAVSGTLTIPAGDVSAAIDVVVTGDQETESDEQLLVNLLNASANARIDDDEGIGLIRDNDLSKVSIEPAVATEPDTGDQPMTALVVLNAPASGDVEVAYETTAGTATAGVDYVDVSGSVVIPAGDVDAPIVVSVLGDLLVESPETIEISLVSVSGPAAFGQVSAYATILDNDDPNAPLTLSGSGGGVIEGNAGATDMQFQLTLNRPAVDSVSVSYSTSPGSAVPPDDYVSLAGTTNIPAGELSVVVAVPILGDTLEEPDETVFVNIDSAGPGVVIGTPQLTGTIVDDDTETSAPVRLSVLPAEVVEGDTGTVDLVFDLNLDGAASDPVSVDYRTEPGSAIEGVDYARAEGSLTFQPGQRSNSVTVAVFGDEFSEDDEFLRLRLSNLTGGALFDGSSTLGTILTDEPLTRLSLIDIGGPEGDSGTSDQVFVVELDVASMETVSLDFATADGTAVAGEDYVLTGGAAQIPPGDLRAMIAVPIIGDTLNENDETYSLTLSNVSVNAVVVDGEAIGTIVNDDGTPGWQAPVSLGVGFQPDVSLDALGNGAIVFTGPTNPATFRSAAEVTRIEAGVWQAPASFGSFTRSNERPPLTTTTGNGEVMISWGGHIGSAVYNPASGWTEETIDSSGGFYPSLDGNNTGMAIAGWEAAAGPTGPYSIWRNAYESSAGWAGTESAENDDSGSAGFVKAAIDDAGNRFMFWSQSFSDAALSGTYYDYYDAATQAWMGPTQAVDIPNARNFDLAMMGDGRAALVVRMSEGLSPAYVNVFIYDPSTARLTQTGALSERASEIEVLPRIVADPAGNLFVAWVQERADGFYDAWANRYDATAGAWGTPTRLEASDGDVRISDGAVDIAVDGAGNAMAVWSQATVVPNSTFRMRTTRYVVASDEWTPAEQIDDASLNEYPKFARIAMDGSGNAVVVWEYDTANEIGAAIYIAP